jgi:DNA-binding CsgD family transcriptional regulator
MTGPPERDDTSTPVLLVGSDGVICSANAAAQQLWGATPGQDCMGTVSARDAGGRVVCHDGCPRGKRSSDTRWAGVYTRDKVGVLHCSSMGDLIAVSVQQLGDAPSALGRLTSRERQVLSLVAEGLTITAIAERLGVQPSTTRTHAERCRRKLRARSLAEAVARASATHQLDGG